MLKWLFRNKEVAVHTAIQHEHDLKRLAILTQPRREVWDCGCGVRKIITFGDVDSIQEIVGGSSLDNAIIYNGDGSSNIGGARLL